MIDSASTSQVIMSVDVEEYFRVEAFSGVVRREHWEEYPSRVITSTQKLLYLFDRKGIKATFFFLGWVAKRHPQLVRDVANRGHELACHYFWHRLIYELTTDEFLQDTCEAKDCIEQAASVNIYGYRAPSFSVTQSSLWAIDILAELGFRYDSSIFPVRHDIYGMPDASQGPFQIMTVNGKIMEFPIATFNVGWGSPNFPVGGGGYLRLLPGWYTAVGLRRARRQGKAVVSYIHRGKSIQSNHAFLRRCGHA